MATAVRAQFCSGCTGVFFLGSWREVAGMTVRKRTILVVVCGVGALRYMFFVIAPALTWMRLTLKRPPASMLAYQTWGSVYRSTLGVISGLI